MSKQARTAVSLLPPDGWTLRPVYERSFRWPGNRNRTVTVTIERRLDPVGWMISGPGTCALVPTLRDALKRAEDLRELHEGKWVA